MSDILSQLSSQKGERDFSSNIKVAEQCLKTPTLLKEISEGLKNKDKALIADCAEVFTKVAETTPGLVAPFVDDLAPLLSHKYTRARWEAIHAISLVAHLVPDKISGLLQTIMGNIRDDDSVIVRDYGTDTLTNYAAVNKDTAQEVYPYLKEVLELWNNKHSNRALVGLKNVVKQLPEQSNEIKSIAEKYQDSPRGVVKKAAKDLLKVL